MGVACVLEACAAARPCTPTFLRRLFLCCAARHRVCWAPQASYQSGTAIKNEYLLSLQKAPHLVRAQHTHHTHPLRKKTQSLAVSPLRMTTAAAMADDASKEARKLEKAKAKA